MTIPQHGRGHERPAPPDEAGAAATMPYALDARDRLIATERAALPLPAGERFGRYRLLEKVGTGGMAEIYKAVAEGSHGFERLFVLKRIRENLRGSPEFVRLFSDEARLSALLHHPNLVQVYEFGQQHGVHFLVMEYLSGHDLASVLRTLAKRDERLPAAVAAFIAHEVARGLAYAHALCDGDGAPVGLVHRDVSPANIMLLRAGAVKLVDFGVARAEPHVRIAVTKGKGVKGKLSYMSPEQMRGDPVDRRTDVFALGIVLWEMLVGRPLFASPAEFDTMRKVLREPVPPPSQHAPHVPPALEAIALRALGRDPEDRYQSADEMADALEAALRALPCARADIPTLLGALFGPPPREALRSRPELPAVRDEDLALLAVHEAPTVAARHAAECPTTSETAPARAGTERKAGKRAGRSMLTTFGVVVGIVVGLALAQAQAHMAARRQPRSPSAAPPLSVLRAPVVVAAQGSRQARPRAEPPIALPAPAPARAAPLHLVLEDAVVIAADERPAPRRALGTRRGPRRRTAPPSAAKGDGHPHVDPFRE